MRTIVAATAMALMVLPTVRDVHAQAIGDIDVRSRIGEKFFAAVPVQSERALDPNCIQVSRNPSAPQGAQDLSAARIRINPTGAVESVIIESAGPVSSPLIGLRLQVGCVNPSVRDFVVQNEAVPASLAPDLPVQRPIAAVPARAAPRAQAPRAATRGPAPAPRAAAGPQAAVPAPQVAATQPRAATPAPKVPPVARAEDGTPKAPIVTGHSIPLPAGAVPATPAAPVSTADQEAQKRISDLRARSDDHAANLLALEDRLSLLTKQAELLKAQLEQTIAAPAASPSASTPAPVATTEAPATVVAAGAMPVTPVAAAPAATRSFGDVLSDWRVIGGALGGVLIAALAYGFGRRKTLAPDDYSAAATAPAWQQPVAREPSANTRFDRTQEMQAPVAPREQLEKTEEWHLDTDSIVADETAQWQSRPPTTTTMPVPEGTVPQSAIATQPGIGITRDFHITQQFQPTNERAVALSTADEIVHQARTHYMDDGDTFRAIDLLEMAVSVRSDSTRPWQALFAIYRRENMTERFQRLAVAYRQAFGEDSSWPAIQGMGYAMDPSNPLYAGAAGSPPVAADLLDRWLGVPLDFTAHLLANEMHDQLMETFPGRGKKKRAGE